MSSTSPSGEPPFDVARFQEAGVQVVDVRGEVDLDSTERLTEELDAAAQAGGPVLADLTRVTFIDSSGLAVLIRARGRGQAAGRRFAIACDPDGPMSQLVDLTGTDQVFEVFPSRVAALAALRG